MTTHELPDFEDKSDMLALLRQHLTVTEGGFFYTEKWSDLAIAQAVNSTFKAHHAATVRRAKFGKLAVQKAPSVPPPSRLDILEARILRIIDVLATTTRNPPQFRRRLLDGPSTTAHLDDIQ